MASQKLSKKISVKSIVGKILVERDPETGIPIPAPERPVLRVYGMAMKTKTVATQYGESTGFLGTFEGVNLANGDIIRGSECWLPKVVEELLAPVVEANPTGVQLAFDLTIRPTDKAVGIGYEYGITNLLPQEEAEDPLSAMRKALPALPMIGNNSADAEE